MQSWTVKSFKLKIIYRKHINTSVKQNHRHDYTQNSMVATKKHPTDELLLLALGKWEKNEKFPTNTRRNASIRWRRENKSFSRFEAIWSLCLRLPIEWHAIEVCIVYATASGCCVALEKVAEARLIMLCFTCTQLMHTIQTTYLSGVFFRLIFSWEMHRFECTMHMYIECRWKKVIINFFGSVLFIRSHKVYTQSILLTFVCRRPYNAIVNSFCLS